MSESFEIKEVLMLEGCPHCGDGLPAIVTYNVWKAPRETEFLGDGWTKKLIYASLKYPQLRIMACRKLEEEE